jgi:hypothetical protein
VSNIEVPTPEKMAQAIWLGAALEQVRDGSGRVVAIKIVWPGWPNGVNPYWEQLHRDDH